MNHRNNVIRALLGAMLTAGCGLLAQNGAPEIKFDSVPNAVQLPPGIYLGEVGGVATNSRGDLFVYTRTGHPTITIGTARPFAHGGSRLFQFDKTGKYLHEIGQDSYGFLVAQQVRVDPQDHIWVVDQMSSMVIEFDQSGQVQMLLGRKSESERVPALPLNPQPGGLEAARGGEGGRGRGGAEAGGRAGAEAGAEGPPRRGGRGGPPGAGAQ